MKKMIFLVAAVAAVSAGVYGSSYLFAQGNGGAPAQPAAQPGTKIAVVNIGEVFNKYTRAVAFKTELEQTLKPYKDKAKLLTDDMKKWDDELRLNNTPQQRKELLAANIVKNKRDLEDMGATIQKLLGTKQEENLVTLWKEVNMGVEAVAKAYGFQIVLAYGNPIDKDIINQFPNVNRLMQAMDVGSTVPLYVHGSVDLSTTIVQTLNEWCKTPRPVTPVSGQK